MGALITSFGMVAIAEIGDKTQLLSFVLAARFLGQHGRVIAGIFVATILNHLCAATAGDWIAAHINAGVMRWVLGLSFLGFAAWALVPDALDAEADKRFRYGAFLTTIGLFFFAEMGDKTQFATVALGARYASLAMVTAGTTLGMMAANIPAVLIGDTLAKRFPLSKMRFVAAAMFAIFGALILILPHIGQALLIGRPAN